MTEQINDINVDGGNKNRIGKFIKSFLIYGILGLILAYGIRFVVEPTVVVGHSMDSTLANGQYMLDDRLAYLFHEPHRGDIVIAHPNYPGLDGKYIIKRVIGLPGDTIEIKNNQLYLNGKEMKEPYIKEPMRNNPEMKFKLGKDQVFIMGDNRNNSFDSRYFGPVNYKKEIRGEVFFRVNPFNESFKVHSKMIPVAQ